MSDPLHDAPPTDPATGQPDRDVEVATLKQWFRQNAVALVLSVAAVVLVCVYLDPVDVLKVVFGLGLIIFIHELGHFLAAKWCDVHVKTFAIGFPPPIPFCSYKWGETTYMIGIIPLGGYVSMVGEGEGGDDDHEVEDPRSFKHKSVGQRMLIISAGVIMNILLGVACFAAAYLHGVREQPAAVGWVESGGAAWRAGIRTGTDVTKIGTRENPFFDDLRPVVMSTLKDERLPVEVEYNGKRETLEVVPLRDEGVPFPQLGIAPPQRLTLASAKKKGFKPVAPGTPAAKVDGLEGGDRVVAMTDPADPSRVTPLPADPKQKDGSQRDYAEYHRRMVLLAGKPVTLHLVKKDEPDTAAPKVVTLEPAFLADFGVRMQMGEVAAVRRGGPAAAAGVQPHRTDEAGNPVHGDKIAAVGVTLPDGKPLWFANGDKPPEAGAGAVEQRPLDPMKLPHELEAWAASNPPDKTVKLVVLRTPKGGHTDERVLLTMPYDDGFRFDREGPRNPNSPLPVSGLGLAYWVEPVVEWVDPAGPAAGVLQPGDVVSEVRFNAADDAGAAKPGGWDEVKGHQWAAVESVAQRVAPYKLDLKVKRGATVVEASLTGKPDPARPADERGLLFQPDQRVQQATGVLDAVTLGAYRTVRFIKVVYQNLYALVFGRVSAKTISGPLTIATVSYKIAGEDIWQYLLFLGMISVNLAVVNFLPIPVLDGGHMVFLIYEKIVGRPLPERVFGCLMYLGLGIVLLLLVFSLTQDVRRLFLGW